MDGVKARVLEDGFSTATRIRAMLPFQSRATRHVKATPKSPCVGVSLTLVAHL